jgi:hypothetical protein
MLSKELTSEDMAGLEKLYLTKGIMIIFRTELYRIMANK